MRVTLGMIVKNEEYYLSRIVPKIREHFDEFVVVDAESTDRSREIVSDYGGKVIVRPWTNNYSEARNSIFPHVSGDWMFMLDADEAMLHADIEKVKSRMSETTFIVLPRIEFVGDHDHYDDCNWPDRQGRVFKLGVGYHFRNKIHEMIYRGQEHPSAWEMKYGIIMDDCQIYHYGQCKPNDKIWLRHHNYSLLQQGLPLLDSVPSGVDVGVRMGPKVFAGLHPLKGVL